MSLKSWLIGRELRKLRDKLMGHRVKTWIEGLGIAVVLSLLSYSADNVSLLMGDKKAFYAGIFGAALLAARGYVAARYAVPPDVKEQIQQGTFPERRDTGTRIERVPPVAEAKALVVDAQVVLEKARAKEGA